MKEPVCAQKYDPVGLQGVRIDIISVDPDGRDPSGRIQCSNDRILDHGVLVEHLTDEGLKDVGAVDVGVKCIKSLYLCISCLEVFYGRIGDIRKTDVQLIKLKDVY